MNSRISRRPGLSRAQTPAGRGVGVAAGLLLGCLTAAAQAQSDRIYLDPHAPLEARVKDLVARLTLEEKVALMAGGSSFGTSPIFRLGIPALQFSDGPAGVRSNEGRATTVFPTGSALAATWDPAAVREVGEAIGREALALRVAVMLGPNVNIQRVPLAGRNFEDYSEDPLLSGQMGVAMVQGIQSQGVGASVKHFVGNEQEMERLRSNSQIDERTLHEIYLKPFEMVVAKAHPWTLMVSYNQVNGTFMSENRPLITQLLQGEWGYDGAVMSDWGAVHSTVAAAGSGLDLEMPGPAKFFGRALTAALRNGELGKAPVEAAARRMARLILRSGVLDGRIAPPGELLSPRNHKAALDAALGAVVLLKNEQGLLPLDRDHLGTLAVIGPNADVPLYGGGGSARANPAVFTTPLEQLQHLAPGVHIVYARGVDNDEAAPPIDPRLLEPAGGKPGSAEHGLTYHYYASDRFQGAPVESGVEDDFDKVGLASRLAQMSARWEGFLVAPDTGSYELSVSAAGQASVEIDGKRILGPAEGTELPPLQDFGPGRKVASVTLEAGHRYPIRVDYQGGPSPFHSLRLGLRRPKPSIEAAVAAAKGADAVLVFAGSSRGTETEGRDRSTLALSDGQDALITAVLAANPRAIVVLQSGSPYELPWADKVPAIVEGWLAGEAGPAALAQVLLGDVNPSGKLPMTFPRQLADTPTASSYPAKDAVYGEGVQVGYRSYERRQVEPLFPFGHGLSYTRFEYSDLAVPSRMSAAKPLEISLKVRNAGGRPGRETVQLYVGDTAGEARGRPVKELKAFEKVSLGAGETGTVRFRLTPSDLAYYDATQHKWVSPPGTYHLSIGSSSRDIRLSRDIQWGAAKK